MDKEIKWFYGDTEVGSEEFFKALAETLPFLLFTAFAWRTAYNKIE